LATIVISYRRGDEGWAGRLYDALAHEFSVALNLDGLDPDRWRSHLREEFIDCRVLIVVIGPDWVKNLQRLSDQEDWVRSEILAGLEAGDRIRPIPVLVGNVPFPDIAMLPAPLSRLAGFQYWAVPPERWSAGVAELIERLKTWLMPKRDRPNREAVSERPPQAVKVFAPASGDRSSTFVFFQDSVDVINLALVTGRPLLVRGPYGSGKTSFGRAIAIQLGAKLH